MTVSSTGPGSVFLGAICKLRLPVGLTVPNGSIETVEAFAAVQLNAVLSSTTTLSPTRL